MGATPTPTVSLRIPQNVLATLDVAARRQVRTRTGQILRYIREGLIRDGCPVPDQDGPAHAS